MKLISFLSVVALAVPTFAAIPSKPSKSSSLQEILSLPEESRHQIGLQKRSQIYTQLLETYRSPAQPMQTRWKALTLAAFIEKDKSLPELEKALKSPEWFIRNAALVSLNSYHPQRAKKAAATLLTDKALVVRSAAVEVLGSPEDLKTRDLMWRQLNSKQNFRKAQGLWIRGQILTNLAKNPYQNENQMFMKALADQDLQLHEPAIAGLETITKMKLGNPSHQAAQKRQLWLQWAKSQETIKAN